MTKHSNIPKTYKRIHMEAYFRISDQYLLKHILKALTYNCFGYNCFDILSV